MSSNPIKRSTVKRRLHYLINHRYAEIVHFSRTLYFENKQNKLLPYKALSFANYVALG